MEVRGGSPTVRGRQSEVADQLRWQLTQLSACQVPGECLSSGRHCLPISVQRLQICSESALPLD